MSKPCARCGKSYPQTFPALAKGYWTHVACTQRDELEELREENEALRDALADARWDVLP